MAPSPPPPASAKPPRRSRRRLWLTLGLLLVIGVVIAAYALQPRPAATPVSVAPSAPRLVARGQVRPIAQARVGTLLGGTLNQLLVEVGQPVEAEQELARLRGADGSTEVVSAPWRGTVMSLPVHVGDTLTLGAMVATIGDMTRFQIETTDVDEFLIAHVWRGRYVTMTVDALDGREIGGVVRSVTLQPQTNSTGDDHYPVTLDLSEQPRELRVGMTVRITLDE